VPFYVSGPSKDGSICIEVCWAQGCECVAMASLSPCSWAVNTGVISDTRVHGPCVPGFILVVAQYKFTSYTVKTEKRNKSERLRTSWLFPEVMRHGGKRQSQIVLARRSAESHHIYVITTIRDKGHLKLVARLIIYDTR